MTAAELHPDLIAVIEGGTPFARTLGAKLVSAGGGRTVMALDPPDSLLNHVGGPHAATLFGFAETAAAGVVVTLFEDLVQDGAVPLIKGAEISYSAVARGSITATATFAGDAEGVRASVAQRGVAVFPVEVALATADGVQTAHVVAQMALKRF